MNSKHPMSIGELKANLRRKPKDARVLYDFVYFHPAGVHSYRGYYDRPAIGYASNGDAPTVEAVLAMLDKLTSGVFTGYKGGEYSYQDDQPLYVANHSETGDTMIVDVFNDDVHDVRLETAVFG